MILGEELTQLIKYFVSFILLFQPMQKSTYFPLFEIWKKQNHNNSFCFFVFFFVIEVEHQNYR